MPRTKVTQNTTLGGPCCDKGTRCPREETMLPRSATALELLFQVQQHSISGLG